MQRAAAPAASVICARGRSHDRMLTDSHFTDAQRRLWALRMGVGDGVPDTTRNMQNSLFCTRRTHAAQTPGTSDRGRRVEAWGYGEALGG